MVLLIYSSNSAESDQVPKELSLAENRKTFVVPYKIDDVELSGSFEYFLTGAHWIIANPAKKDYKIDELCTIAAGIIQASKKNVVNNTYIDNLTINNSGASPMQSSETTGNVNAAPKKQASSSPSHTAKPNKKVLIPIISAAALIVLVVGIAVGSSLNKRENDIAVPADAEQSQNEEIVTASSEGKTSETVEAAAEEKSVETTLSEEAVEEQPEAVEESVPGTRILGNSQGNINVYGFTSEHYFSLAPFEGGGDTLGVVDEGYDGYVGNNTMQRNRLGGDKKLLPVEKVQYWCISEIDDYIYYILKDHQAKSLKAYRYNIKTDEQQPLDCINVFLDKLTVAEDDQENIRYTRLYVSKEYYYLYTHEDPENINIVRRISVESGELEQEVTFNSREYGFTDDNLYYVSYLDGSHYINCVDIRDFTVEKAKIRIENKLLVRDLIVDNDIIYTSQCRDGIFTIQRWTEDLKKAGPEWDLSELEGKNEPFWYMNVLDGNVTLAVYGEEGSGLYLLNDDGTGNFKEKIIVPADHSVHVAFLFRCDEGIQIVYIDRDENNENQMFYTKFDADGNQISFE